MGDRTLRERLLDVMKWGLILRLPYNALVKRDSGILSFIPSLMGVIFFANFLYLGCCTPPQEADSIVSTTQVNRAMKKASRFLTQKIRDNAYSLFVTSTDGRQEKAFKTFIATNSKSELVFEKSQQNNFGIHPEVNANVFTLLQGTSYEKHINYNLITRSQTGEGYWHSYFYPSCYYGTYMALSVINNKSEFKKSESCGISFILRTQNQDGSWGSPAGSYETALPLNALASCNRLGEAYQKGLLFLPNNQMKDGSWQTYGIIWEYVWRDDPKVVWKAHDSNRIITTSLAAEGIICFQTSLMMKVIF